MKKLTNKLASGVAGVGLFVMACVMAGIGLSVMVFLAMFALAVIGFGILAAPLFALMEPRAEGATDEVQA